MLSIHWCDMDNLICFLFVFCKSIKTLRQCVFFSERLCANLLWSCPRNMVSTCFNPLKRFVGDRPKHGWKTTNKVFVFVWNALEHLKNYSYRLWKTGTRPIANSTSQFHQTTHRHGFPSKFRNYFQVSLSFSSLWTTAIMGHTIDAWYIHLHPRNSPTILLSC